MSIKRRSQGSHFSFATHCFFCENSVSEKKLNYDRQKVHFVSTIEFFTSLKLVCEERRYRWSTLVLSRINFVGDLHAAGALYHQTCNVRFRTGKTPPIYYTLDDNRASQKCHGRPKDLQSEEAFLSIVNDFVNNDEGTKTISELCEEMANLCPNPYSKVYMKQRILELMGEKVTISCTNGKADVITFNETVASIINKHHKDARNTQIDPKELIIKTAVSFIKQDIIDTYKFHSKEVYPNPSDFDSLDKNLDFLPATVKLFLDELIVGKSKGTKIASLGHCLVQCARPRAVLSPLQFGLGVQMHHMFNSKFLIESLNSLGFCSSYEEVINYEACVAAQTPSTSDFACDTISPVDILMRKGHFRQYVCDNADRNPCSLDGKKSLHAMGIIEAITPSINAEHHIKRNGPKDVKTHIQTLHYETPSAVNELFFQELTPPPSFRETRSLDLL